MVFSSTVFLFIFLPAVWLLYTLIPKRYLGARNFLLAAASLFFYAYGEPVYIIIMLASVFFNYVMSMLMTRFADTAASAICTLCVVTDLAVLAFFKYVPWLVTLANGAFGLDIPVPPYTIPVGISFYTFQILSYVVDVRCGKTEVQTKFFDLLLYISFFPQLIAGPIVKYGDIKDQIGARAVTVDGTARGIRRFICGLAKKVVISNTAAVVAEAAFKAAEPSSALLWAGAVCYCIQLYFDFSGYSDMAIGLAHIFGFELLENFNYPYAATCIRDFWKRWHISLTSWFREYVYFPLGGNRKGKVRTVVNRLAVFFLTGLWHGANFTYIIWGMWHGLLMLLEEVAGIEQLAKKKALQPIFRLYTLLAVCLGFVVFNSPSMSFALDYIGGMFRFSGAPGDVLALMTPYTVLMLVLGVILSLPVLPKVRALLARDARTERIGEIAGYALTLPLFALCVMTLASTSFNPFIYYIF
ncbi:MAG: MBOAT family protein [Clostridia bacterium]|nr:MBOAT family protein [Clostridia bacterium]